MLRTHWLSVSSVISVVNSLPFLGSTEPGGNNDHRAREGLIPNPQAPLREQVREVMRFHHYALRTERAYWRWIVRLRQRFGGTSPGMKAEGGIIGLEGRLRRPGTCSKVAVTGDGKAPEHGRSP